MGIARLASLPVFYLWSVHLQTKPANREPCAIKMAGHTQIAQHPEWPEWLTPAAAPPPGRCASTGAPVRSTPAVPDRPAAAARPPAAPGRRPHRRHRKEHPCDGAL